LSFSAGEIATAVQGTLEGEASLQICDAAGLDEASAEQISFFHNAKYIGSLEKTNAGAVLVPEKTGDLKLPAGKTLIKVKNPQWAFAQVLGMLERARIKHPRGVSPQAAIDPSAKIGAGVAVGAFAVIESGASIGDGTIVYAGCFIGANSKVGKNSILYPNVVLREEVTVGDRAIIHAGAVLGADGYGFATIEGKHQKIPQIGRVVVEDDVEIGANVTVDRATTGETRIGAGTKIDNLVHIAHNVRIGRDCLIVAQVGISGSTTVGDRVTLAGQVGVVGHVHIGDGAIITAQTGIMNDVAPGAVLFGTPARPHREAMKLLAIFGKLPEIYSAVKALRKKAPMMSE
jgi:UDP-3-O-[3-hydroxymyristoyl] glucosamine N-acyltransferase